MKMIYDPPGIIKKVYSNTRWESGVPKILLTFDDGPIPETTPMILDLLDELDIKSIFFCVGENIRLNYGLAEEIIRRGHSIGNHTYNHKNLIALSPAGQKKQLELFDKVYREIFNSETDCFRPPKGRIPLNYNSLLGGKKNIMWNLLTYDYKNDLNIVKFAVQNFLKQNSIVVLHDSLKSKDIILNAIKYISEKAKEKNYEFGEPAECLK